MLRKHRIVFGTGNERKKKKMKKMKEEEEGGRRKEKEERRKKKKLLKVVSYSHTMWMVWALSVVDYMFVSTRTHTVSYADTLILNVRYWEAGHS